jgi:hypothetical protein
MSTPNIQTHTLISISIQNIFFLPTCTQVYNLNSVAIIYNSSYSLYVCMEWKQQLRNKNYGKGNKKFFFNDGKSRKKLYMKTMNMKESEVSENNFIDVKKKFTPLWMHT